MGIGLWVSMDAYRSYSYRSERSIFVSALQKARLEAMVNLNEAPHGIYVEQNKYTIFQGSAYDAGSSLNKVIEPPGVVVITGSPALPREIIFEQLSGATVDTGTLTVSDGVRETVVTINEEGGISW